MFSSFQHLKSPQVLMQCKPVILETVHWDSCYEDSLDIYLFISCPLFILETIVFFFREPKIKRLPCFRNTQGGRERWRGRKRERDL